MSEDVSRVCVYAVIPAAGASTRMGQLKPLLPLGHLTLLETVIEAVLWGDMDGLCVVTSSPVDRELVLREDPRFLLAINDDAPSQMLDSVRMGMAALYARFHVKHEDGLLVCPGDLPRVTPEDVRAVTHAYRKQPGRIVIAAHQGKPGHPMIFPVSMAPEVRDIREGGLKVLNERHPAEILWVERESRGVVEDVDTPEDFDRLGRSTSSGGGGREDGGHPYVQRR